MHFPRQVMTYFGAGAIQALLSIALLPLATRVLGPAEYGSYAFAMAVTALAAALSDPGCGIVLSSHYGVAKSEDRRRMLTTMLLASTGLAITIAVLLHLAWPLLASASGQPEVVSATGVVLACLAIPFRVLIATGTCVLILQVRSDLVGAVTLTQALLSFGISLMGLFWWHMGVDALFLGSTLGLVAGALVTLGIFQCQFAKPALEWFRHLARVMPSALFAGLTDGLRPVIESTVLVRGAGTTGLGLYNHSKIYYAYCMQATNAFAYALWPRALAEARDGNGRFELVGRAWNAIYLGLTAAGIGFAALGHEIVAWLTNGKFVEAAPWVPAWIAYLLLQNSGKAATAVLFAGGQGARVSRLRAGTVLCALGALFVLVPRWGIPAAVGIAFADLLLFRVLIHLAAKRIQAVPNLDVWCFAGCALIGIATVLFHHLPLSLLNRAGILIGAILLLAIVGRQIVNDGWRQIRAAMVSRNAKGA